MLSICTIASGSSGNATLVFNEDTSLLIDAGISAKRICAGLAQAGRSPASLSGICVTHSHSDHVSGLRVLLKKTTAPLYTTAETGDTLRAQLPGIEGWLSEIFAGESFQVGSLTVHPFSTPHDARGSVGFTVTDGVRKFALVTDLGYVTEEVYRSILGTNTALVEANHDVDWLMTGPYPAYLKQRIRGNQGHLSNEDCGSLCCELAGHGTEKLILGHLSQENNSPEHAHLVVSGMLRTHGLDHVSVTVASRNDCSPVIEV